MIKRLNNITFPVSDLKETVEFYEKEYLVATSDYFAKRAKRFLGEEVEYEDVGIQVNEAMVQWFKQYKKIGKIQPRIKVLR